MKKMMDKRTDQQKKTYRHRLKDSQTKRQTKTERKRQTD